MPITIRNLAEKLNLSITTVSRALDGYSDVSEETRQRVIHAANEMGYEPSYAARHLRRQRADSIGYILPTSMPQFADPFYSSFLTGVCDEAASLNLDLMVSSCPPESEREKSQYQRWIKSRRVDGLILNRVRVQDWRVDMLLESGVPFVSLGKSETSPSYPHIFVNERGGFGQLVHLLVNKGHRKIAYVGGVPELVLQVERFAGYLQGLERARIHFDPDLVLTGDLTEESGYQAAKSLLDRLDPPTAILACNDLMALGVLRAVQERGIYAGRELAIAGYDGIKETEYTNPPLTTLYQPTYDIARQLVRMLQSQIEGQPLEEQRVCIQPSLIARPSTG
jgi:LacI family transcriptional regulator